MCQDYGNSHDVCRTANRLDLDRSYVKSDLNLIREYCISKSDPIHIIQPKCESECGKKTDFD